MLLYTACGETESGIEVEPVNKGHTLGHEYILYPLLRVKQSHKVSVIQSVALLVQYLTFRSIAPVTLFLMVTW